MGNVYGYIRVSSRDQNENRQIDAMNQIPVPEIRWIVSALGGLDVGIHEYLLGELLGLMQDEMKGS